MVMQQAQPADVTATSGEGPLSIVLFSGTDDKLTAAAVLTAGAAAMGRRVNIFLQYWGLEAFQQGTIRGDHGTSAEAGYEGQRLVARLAESGKTQHWSTTFAQAKEIGDVAIHACALSMEMFELTKDDLDPLVDDVEGVAAFMLDATGPIVFI